MWQYLISLHAYGLHNSVYRHIQKHLGELTGESEQNQDVKDVAAGDNAKGTYIHTLLTFPLEAFQRQYNNNLKLLKNSKIIFRLKIN